MENKFNEFKEKVHKGDYNPEHTPDLVEVNDPSNYAQCMDLAYAWCDFLGIPRDTIRHFYAYQIYTQPVDLTLEHFEYLPNTPKAVPQCGDIVVFKGGTAGHVVIANGEGDLNFFKAYGQNWGDNKLCEIEQYDYSNVLGWLRPRRPVEPQPILITDQTKIDLGEKLGVMEVQAIRSTILDQKKAIKSLETNQKDAIKEAVNTAISENNINWQSKLDIANGRIEGLQEGSASKMSWNDIVSIILIKLKLGGES